MPIRFTTDVNGCVILVESVPEREPPLKPKRGKISVDRTKKYEWNEDKTSRPARKLFGARVSPGPRDSWVSCSLCTSKVKERNMNRHLRKMHSALDGREPTSGSQLVTQPSNKEQEQPKRSEVSGKSEYARKLLCELREEAKVGYGDKVLSPSSGDSAAKGIKYPKGESSHAAGTDSRKTGPDLTKSGAPVRKTKNQASSSAQGIAANQKQVQNLRAEIKTIGKELKKLAPGFHRIKITRLQIRQDFLRDKLEKLERPLTQKAIVQGRFSGRAGKLGAKTKQRKEDSLRERAQNEYGGKYLGHMRRDYDGSFGSISLYDDYGEESFPG